MPALARCPDGCAARARHIGALTAPQTSVPFFSFLRRETCICVCVLCPRFRARISPHRNCLRLIRKCSAQRTRGGVLREAVGDPNSLGGCCRCAPTVGALRDACRRCAFLSCLLLRRLTGSPPSVASSRGHAWACAYLTCLTAGACSSCISPAFDCNIAMIADAVKGQD